MIPSYEWILVCVAVKGVALSMINVISIHIIVGYLGADRYAQVIGFCSLLNGVMMVVVGTVAGEAWCVCVCVCSSPWFYNEGLEFIIVRSMGKGVTFHTSSYSRRTVAAW